jgi:uncharacterized membrane protein YcaP (DUF421 family)
VLASWYFDGWPRLWHIAASTGLLFAGLLILLRIGGKRTLARFTVFDWVVSVAFGSTMASAITSSSVSVADGLVAFASLVLLQTVVALISLFVPGGRSVITGDPTLLAYRGRLLHSRMKRQRVTEPELRQALRQQGFHNLDQVEAIVLETTGDITVLGAGDDETTVLEQVDLPS